MPIYEYQCPNCGEKKEAIRTLGERDLPLRCEKCRTNMKRIDTAPAPQFPGANRW